MTIEKLEDFGAYFNAVRNFFITDTTSIWLDNLFLNATLVRVHQMNKGFIELINNGNYLCTAPLGIRKQNQ